MRNVRMTIWLVVVVVCGITSVSQATLTVLTEGDEKVVCDSNTGKYWYWDLSVFKSMTYEEQINGIESLNSGSGYFGIDDWHLATRTEMDPFWSAYDLPSTEIEDSFNPSYDPTDDGGVQIYWRGRYEEVGYRPDGDSHYEAYHEWHNSGVWRVKPLGVGLMLDNVQHHQTGAWVTSYVPEPTTLLLLGLGGLMLRRKR